MNGLYVLDLSEKKAPFCIESSKVEYVTKKRRDNPDNSIFLCHIRLGHTNAERIYKLIREGHLDKVEWKTMQVCKPYLEGKMTKVPFPSKAERAS